MVLGATVLGGAKIAENMAASSNPWVYLVGLLLIGLALIARHVWKDMKDGQNRLLQLDEEHRKESLKREERLNEQLDKSIDANTSLVDTQKEMITALNGVQNNLFSLEMNMGKRIDNLEKIVQKEGV